MLRTGWLMGFSILWILLQILCSVAAMSTSADVTPLSSFINTVNATETTNILGVATAVVTIPLAAVTLLINLFTFNYSIFTGIYIIVKYIFVAISFSFILSLILTIYSSRSSS